MDALGFFTDVPHDKEGSVGHKTVHQTYNVLRWQEKPPEAGKREKYSPYSFQGKDDHTTSLIQASSLSRSVIK